MSVETFSREAASSMRVAIEDAGGAEVFFVGRPTKQATVGEVQVVARGHETAVPAVLRDAHCGEVLVHNHPSGGLRPSEADLAIASRAGELGLGFIIVDNAVSRSYTVVEPFQPAVRKLVEAARVAELLGPGGRLATALVGYEHRPPQIGMAESVVDAFNQDLLLAAEAGTGTGKSLAYLLPAVLHARENRERVVVSTNTINLQEQLLNKDLPLMASKLGLEFKSTLLKGRSNYLCLRKTDYARQEAPRLFEDERRSSLEAILAWTKTTADGSRSGLSFVPPPEVWEEVSSDADDCLRAESPHFNHCFFFNSRREAASADLVVVNHHLLMADVALRLATGDWTSTAVLPPYTRVVIDEAHNLEDVASDYLAARVSRAGLIKTLRRLRSSRQADRGLLPTLRQGLARAQELSEKEARELEELIVAVLLPRHQELLELTEVSFTRISDGVLGFLGLDELPREELKLRLKPAVLSHPALAEAVLPAARGLSEGLGDYASELARLLAKAEAAGADETPELQSGLTRLRALRLRLEAAAKLLEGLGIDDPEICRWIETRSWKKEMRVSVASAPLSVARLLEQALFSQVKTAVLTSATLTVAGSFDYFSGRLGLGGTEADRVAEARFASPFDFAHQALVVAPADMPEPQEARFAEELASLVERAVIISRGRALVLFTAYGLLNRTYNRLAETLTQEGLVPLRQGEAPRAVLLERFRGTQGAVLFATQSFWEGVDVPGQALSLVILTRLPFRVPTEPLQEARVEAIQREGGDAFTEYSMPQAVIRFRQGFGRLIRTRSDRGAVLIADSRVVRKRYGKLFLDSLPEARVFVGRRQEALDELRLFFAQEPVQSQA